MATPQPHDRQDKLFTESLTEDGRYRLLVEAVTDYAIYMLDVDGYVTSWNPGAQRFKGYRPHEIMGKHFSTFYSEDDRKSGLPERALSAAKNEGRFLGEGWRIRKDGTRFWAGVVIDPIRAPNGDLVGYAKITRDLTERMRAEEDLRRSEEQFRLLVQSVSDYAIYMLDPTGHITNWNAGAQRIKGYLPAEIIGKHFSQFYSADDRAAGMPQQSLDIAIRDGRFEKEGWRYRKDGSRFWASVVIDPIHTPEGKHIGFAKITRDITEKRDAQIALEKAREALFQSQKMEAVGQLTGGIAHDFNNLLMAVLSSLELAGRRLPDDPKLKALIANAYEGAQRGVTLTKRMLAFARRQDLTLAHVDLAQLVSGMNELMARSLGPSIDLQIRISRELPHVRTDANQLESVLLNLVVNGRDAMPQGGAITLAGRTETITQDQADLKPGTYVVLSVTDAGEGMDPATLARATEPFFTTKGVGKGTGLGLSMVHGSAEQMGGRLVLISALGKGTTAEIWLPVSEASAVAPAATPALQPSVASAHGHIILVVDDDRLVRINTLAMLEELGHTVHEAASAQEALEILQRGQPVDLVITDHAMPLMTGTELAQEIKRQRPALPILLVTGYAELPEGVESTLPKLNKPYTLDDLEQAVERYVQAAR